MIQVRQVLSSLSGLPEWLPTGYIVERYFVDILRRILEFRGFSGIQTRVAEPLNEPTKKGETPEEVYLLSRLQVDPADAEPKMDPRKQLGLHFDLTIPFARYVVDNAGLLTFPFKRYQIQKVWRGGRPQEGRFREFIQVDIDIVGDGALSSHHDVEVPLIMYEALSVLPVPAVIIHVSNRRVAQGFYQSIGIDTDWPIEVLCVIDKLDKIGSGKVAAELTQSAGTTVQQVAQALKLATITGVDGQDVSDQILWALVGAEPTELPTEGLTELTALLEATGRRHSGAVIADLKVVRGLDYYIGTVYESFMAGHEDLGSVCSGGRYDSLATNGRRTFPGMGISIGLSRLLARVIGEGSVQVSRAVPATVLVIATDGAYRCASDAVADMLRARDISVDVALSATRFGKQIKAADKRSIPSVWFPGFEGVPDSAKDIRSSKQVEADATTWQLPTDDAISRVTVSPAADCSPAGSQDGCEVDSASRPRVGASPAVRTTSSR